jgi:hypothetical protein
MVWRLVLVSFDLPEQLGQPCDIDGDPSRLVFGERLRLPGLSFVGAGVKVGKGLPVGVGKGFFSLEACQSGAGRCFVGAEDRLKKRCSAPAGRRCRRG